MKDYEKKADEILKTYAHALAKNRAEELKDEKDFIERKYVEVNKKKLNMLKRVSIICVCTICLFAGFSVTSEANLAQIFSFIFDKQDSYSDIVSSKNPPAAESITLEYIPEGYELTYEMSIPGGCEQEYVNESTSEKIYIIVLNDESSYNTIDNETTPVEECFVGDCQGYLFEHDQFNTLIWQIDNYYIEIQSPLDKEEMIKIGRNLKL